MKNLNVSFYHFKDLGDPAGLRETRIRLRDEARALELRGTILLASEGFNCYYSGPAETVRKFTVDFLATFQVNPMDVKIKESWSDEKPFSRMLVKVKKAIIPLDAEVQPTRKTGKRIDPLELKKWFDDQKEMIVLDTRNDYEVEIGTFQKAENLQLRHFRNFARKIESLPPDQQQEWKKRPIVTFCTGGIRCEKASAYLVEQGYDAYQLEGGILKYFEDCGDAHWNGECFVFDQRVAVNGALEETRTTQCFACRHPLSEEDQQTEAYIPGERCPYCESFSRGVVEDTSINLSTTRADELLDSAQMLDDVSSREA